MSRDIFTHSCLHNIHLGAQTCVRNDIRTLHPVFLSMNMYDYGCTGACPCNATCTKSCLVALYYSDENPNDHLRIITASIPCTCFDIE